jgi:hypothetical protein
MEAVPPPDLLSTAGAGPPPGPNTAPPVAESPLRPGKAAAPDRRPWRQQRHPTSSPANPVVAAGSDGRGVDGHTCNVRQELDFGARRGREGSRRGIWGAIASGHAHQRSRAVGGEWRGILRACILPRLLEPTLDVFSLFFTNAKEYKGSVGVALS